MKELIPKIDRVIGFLELLTDQPIEFANPNINIVHEYKSKKNEIVLLDLFSGTGGFSKGLEEAGYHIKQHYFSEIDKYAVANYQYNFKNSIIRIAGVF